VSGNGQPFEPPPIIGDSRAIREAVGLARRIAPSQLSVLLVAPTGCGKELFAHHIHRWSGRPGDLLAINSAALPEHLVEAELFGHDGQACTGARRPKPGLIEVADRRTCFLDEVVSLPALAQAKLLRVVETGEVWRVGETQPRRVDVRFVAAAQEDLDERIADGRVRRDLFQRLAGVVLRIPPLAERPEDVLPLARQYCALMGRELARGVEVEHLLVGHSWPGNVRELRQVVERAALVQWQGAIGAAAVREAIALGSLGRVPGTNGNGSSGPGDKRESERTNLLAALQANEWHAGRAAATLAMHRATLFRRLKGLGLSLRGLRESHESHESRATPCDCATR